MKYVVLYQSNSGNTEKIARAIFDSIESEAKELIDIYDVEAIPESDVYFVGFAVYNQSCSLSVMECLSNIERGKIALFSTCGFYPTERYKENIEKNMYAWINEDVEYMGMYLCQGRMQASQQEQFVKEASKVESAMREIFNEGESHPDQDDIRGAELFADSIVHS